MSALIELAANIGNIEYKSQKQRAILESLQDSYLEFKSVDASCNLDTEEGKNAFEVLNGYQQIKLMADILEDYIDDSLKAIKDAQDECENLIEQARHIKQII